MLFTGGVGSSRSSKTDMSPLTALMTFRSPEKLLTIGLTQRGRTERTNDLNSSKELWSEYGTTWQEVEEEQEQKKITTKTTKPDIRRKMVVVVKGGGGRGLGEGVKQDCVWIYIL